jgi:hypothetical protein
MDAGLFNIRSQLVLSAAGGRAAIWHNRRCMHACMHWHVSTTEPPTDDVGLVGGGGRGPGSAELWQTGLLR